MLVVATWQLWLTLSVVSLMVLQTQGGSGPAVEGYEYVGRHILPNIVPAVQGRHALDIEHHTLMFTNDGHIYRKRLSTGGLTKDMLANPAAYMSQFPPFPPKEEVAAAIERLTATTDAPPAVNFDTTAQRSVQTADTTSSNSLSSQQQVGSSSQEADSTVDGSTTTARRLLRGQPLAELHRRARQLLQSTSLSPTLACDGCPSTDTRTRVNDTTVFPYTAVGMVTRVDSQALSNSITQCSGTLIGRQHVLTAGHCVVDTESQSTITGMQFWPAFNSNDEPFDPISVSRTYVLNQFAQQKDVSTESLNYDFAIMLLSKAAPAGTAQLAIQAGSGTQRFDLTTAGYPGDKPQGTMWTVGCPNVQFAFDGDGITQCGDACSNMVKHDCLTSQGQSGSGIWDNTNTTVRAIVTGAFTIGNTNYNVGTEMNPFVYNTIAQWYNEDATEPLALTPAPPSAPVSHRSPSGNGIGNWISNHLYVPILPAVIGGVVGLVLLFLLLKCLRRCCCQPRRPKQPPQPMVQGYPIGTYGNGAYAAQYAAHAQNPAYAQPQQQQQPGSDFARSFYQSGDPRYWQGQGQAPNRR